MNTVGWEVMRVQTQRHLISIGLQNGENWNECRKWRQKLQPKRKKDDFRYDEICLQIGSFIGVS